MAEKEKGDIQDKNNVSKVIETLTIKEVLAEFYRLFSRNGHRRTYSKRSTVFQLNDRADEVYAVESGRVRIYKLTPEGNEVTFGIMNRGNCFGFAELLVNSARLRHAQTICKTTLWVMSKEQLFELFYSNSDLALKNQWILTQELLRYQNIIEDLAILPVRDRIVKLLIRLSKEESKSIRENTTINFPLTHEEIAQMVGSSRQTVNLILNELRKEGIITWEQRKIKILRRMDLMDEFF